MSAWDLFVELNKGSELARKLRSRSLAPPRSISRWPPTLSACCRNTTRNAFRSAATTNKTLATRANHIAMFWINPNHARISKRDLGTKAALSDKLTLKLNIDKRVRKYIYIYIESVSPREFMDSFDSDTAKENELTNH